MKRLLNISLLFGLLMLGVAGQAKAQAPNQPDLTFVAGVVKAYTLASPAAGSALDSDANILTRQGGGAIPSSLVFDDSTLELRSTTAIAVANSGAYNYYWSDADYNNDGNLVFQIVVLAEAPTETPVFGFPDSANPGDTTLTVGVAATDIILGDAENADTIFYVMNVTAGQLTDGNELAVGSGLTYIARVDASTPAKISGTPTTAGEYAINYQANDIIAGISVAFTFTITVEAAALPPPAFAESSIAFTFTQGIASMVTIPAATGDVASTILDTDTITANGFTHSAVDSGTAEATLPIVISSTTSTPLSGLTPAIVQVVASNADGTESAILQVSLHVLPPPAVFAFPDDANPGNTTLTAGTAATDIILGNAENGVGQIGYQVKVGDSAIDNGKEVATGLTYTAAGGMTPAKISGTPIAAGDIVIEYSATDLEGAGLPTVAFTFTITVQAAPLAFPAGANPGDTTLTVSTDAANIILGDAENSVGTLVYQIKVGDNVITDGNEVALGLTYSARVDSSTPAKIIGVPVAIGDTVIEYIAVDLGDNSHSVAFTFTITVQPSAFVFPDGANPGDTTLTVGEVATDITLGDSVNWQGLVFYDLNAGGSRITDGNEVAPGLTYTIATVTPPAPGKITGTPTAVGDTVIRYQAFDTAGAVRPAFEFTITVQPPPALAFPDGANPGDQAVLTTSVSSITLGNVEGGKAPYMYAFSVDGTAVTNGNEVLVGMTYSAENGGTAATISGTPTALDATGVDVTYIATDANNAMVTFGFNLSVVDKPTFPANFAATYTQNQPNYSSRDALSADGDALTLPAAGGIVGTPVYAVLDNSLPAGLSVADVSSSDLRQVISGSPTETGAFSYTRTATDANGQGTFTLTIQVAAALSFAAAANPSDQSILVGDVANITLGNASGGQATVNYTLTAAGVAITGGGEITAGITYTAISGNTPATISGTPTALNAGVDVTYIATDANNASATFGFNLSVVDIPNFPADVSITYTQNHNRFTNADGSISTSDALTLPAANNGVSPITYATVLSNLPSGVAATVLGDERVEIKGTPTVTGAFTYSRSAIDGNGGDTFTWSGIVAAEPTFGNQDRVHFIVGIADTSQITAATGGLGALTYSIARQDSAALTGLSIDSASGLISATTAATAHTADYIVTATDTNGATATVTFEIAVSAVLTLPTVPGVSFTIGTAGVVTLPAASGGFGTPVYSLGDGASASDSVPAFITNSTRELSYSGATTGVSAGAIAISFIATDTSPTPQTANAGLSITMLSPPTFAAGDVTTLTTGYTFRVGAAIAANLALPESTVAGATPFTYYLTTGASSNYDGTAFSGTNNIAFTAGTRVLSGTPTTAATHQLRYHVRDKNGATASQATSISVIGALSLAAVDDQNFAVGQTGISIELPEATNTIGVVTYNLTGNLPGGIAFDPATRIISGDVAAMAAVAAEAITYTAYDPFDNTTAPVMFNVSVVEKPAFSPAAVSVTYTQNHNLFTDGDGVTSSNDELTLPAATGGSGTPTYAIDIDNLPTGVADTALSDNRVQIKGTPSVVGAFTYSRTATDSVGESTFIWTAIVAAAPTFGNQDRVHFVVGTAGTSQLITATGGAGALAYSLSRTSGTVPGHLTVDSAALLTATGSIAVADSGEYTLTATDINGATATVNFDVSVSTALVLPNVLGVSFTIGTAGNVTMPTASGGYAPLVYSIVAGDDPVPAYLSVINENDGTNDIGILRYNGDATNHTGVLLSFLVTDSGSPTAQTKHDNFIVSMLLPPTFAAGDVTTLSTGYTFRAGAAIAATVLPEASSLRSATPLTYKLTAGASSVYGDTAFSANNIAFTAGTRTLSGTPTTAMAHPLNYHARDKNGAIGSSPANIYVIGALALAQGDINFNVGQTVSLQLPEATNVVGDATYSLTGTLPGSLAFNASNRTLSGTAPATAAAGVAITYKVDDGFDDTSAQVVFNIAIVDAPTFSPSTLLATYTVGSAIYNTGDTASTSGDLLTLPEATGAGGTLAYAELDNSLPSGLSVDDATVAKPVISGSPTQAGAFSYTRTATDTNGMGTFTLTLQVAAAPMFSTTQSQVHFVVGTAGTSQLITASGGAGALAYSLSRTGGTVPAALTVHETTAVLSATGSIAAADSGNYTLTATDINGVTATVNFVVTVSAALTLPSVTDVSFTIGTASTVMLPAASGGHGTPVYSLGNGLSDNVPGHITINSSRELSYDGSTTGVTVGAIAISFVATDTATPTQTVSQGISITMLAKPAFAAGDVTALTNGYTFRVNTAITATELPAVAAGAATPLTYKLTAGASSVYGDTAFNNVNGFVFDAGTRMLTGTPSAAMVHALNYHVRDKNGATTSQATMIDVRGALALVQGNLNFNVNEVVSLQLPEAANVVGTAVYELDGNLPGDLAFNTSNRTLSGTAPSSTAAGVPVTYKVTDSFGPVSAQVVFNIAIVDAPAFSPSTILATYTVGNAIFNTGGVASMSGDALTLPEATAGGTPNYSVHADNNLADSGLSVADVSASDLRQVVSGSPTQAGAFSYTRIAMDSNGEGTFTLTLHVAAEPSFSGTQSQVHFVVSTAGSSQLITASGGAGALAYSLSRTDGTAVSAELSVDSAALLTASGSIAAGDSGEYILTATDINGVTATVTFTVTVSTALTLPTVPGVSFTIGTASTVMLPVASGGHGTPVYSLGNGVSDNVPGHITINNSRELSYDGSTTGITAGAVIAISFTATDAATPTQTASQGISITMLAKPAFAAGDVTALTAGYTFRAGTAITATELPEVIAGAATPLTYKLTAGASSAYSAAAFSANSIVFTAGTRALSGTPTAAMVHALNYHVRDKNGATTSQATMIDVRGALTLAQDDINIKTGTTGFSMQLPVAGNVVGNANYELTGTLPGTLAFNTSNRTLSGNAPATAAAGVPVTYKVTDSFGPVSAQVVFNIAIVDAPAFDPSTILATYTVGSAIYNTGGSASNSGDLLTLPAATAGGTPNYSVLASNSLPNGLSVADVSSTDLRQVISGSPTQAGAFSYTRIAMDDIGMGTFSLTLHIAAAPAFGNRTQSRVHFIDSTAGTSQLITASGGALPLAYSLSRTDGTAVSALSVDSGALLTATSSIAAGADSEYTLTATDINGVTATVNFNVSVSTALALPTIPVVSFTIGTASTAMMPAATGGYGTVAYSLGDGASDANPAFITNSGSELSYDGSTTTAGTIAISFIATDAATPPQTASQGLSIMMLAKPVFAAGDVTTLTNGYTFRAGTAIAANTELPESTTAGATPFTYKLTTGAAYTSGDFAANNIVFTAGSRVLSGTPTTAMVHSLHYHVRDNNGATTTQATKIDVRGALTLAQDDINIKTGTTGFSMQLPVAGNVVGNANYELTGTLPGTLAFNTSNRTLSGNAPATAAAGVPVTYKVTDSFGPVSAQVIFNIAIVDAPVFSPSTILATYTVGSAIYNTGDAASSTGDALTLPAATASGTPNYSVHADNNLADSGLSVANVSASDLRQVVSGSPTQAGVFSYVRIATDTYGMGTFSLTLNIAAAPMFSTTQSRVHFIVGTAGTSQLITASGGALPLAYSLSRTDGSTVPAALSVDSDALLTASGSIADGDTGGYTLTATDINGVTATVNFDVSVSAALTLPTTPGVSFTIGTAGMVMLPAATGGYSTKAYSLGNGATDTVPASITNSGSELRYSGATGVTTGVIAISFTATDSSPTPQTASQGLTITMLAKPTFAAADVTALTAGYTFRAGTTIAATELPAVAAGAATPLTYKLTAGASSVYDDTAFNNVNGFAFDAGTRMLTGTPMAAMVHSLNYYVRDKNGAITTQATKIDVRAVLALARGDINFKVNQVVSEQLPQATNIVGDATYELAGNLPTGLAFTASSRTLSGTAPSSTAAGVAVTYKVTDSFGPVSTQVVFNIAIVDAPVFSPSAIVATYTQNHPIYSINDIKSASGHALTLPLAIGNSGTPNYSVPADNNLTATGLRVANVSSSDLRQVVSGSPTQAGAFSYTRIATDENGMGTFTLTLYVALAPAFSTAQASANFTAGTSGTFSSPATGGFKGELTYSLSRTDGGVVAALSIDADSGEVTAAASIGGADAGAYLITAADSLDATATLRLDVTVGGAVTVMVEDNTFTVGDSLELPVAMQGRAPYTYSITDGSLVGGLTFNPATRAIEGALTVATAGGLTMMPTYNVVDANGATASDAFTLHIIPLKFASGERTLQFRSGEAQSFDLSDELTVAAGAGTVAYAIAPMPNEEGLTYSAATNTFSIAKEFVVEGDTVLSYTFTATYSVGAQTRVATQNIVLKARGGGEELAPVNEEVISKIAATVVGSTLAAITERIAVANIATPLALIGGQTPQTALANYAKAVADDADDNNALLANSRFVLPFASLPSNANVGAIWGSTQMRELDGDVDAVDWSGDVSGLHLGVDFKVGENLIGVAVSKSDADIDYKTTDAQGNPEEGKYEVSLTALHPYINRKFGEVDYWASIGFGEGEMTVTEKGGDAIKSDLSLNSLGVGAGMQIESGLQLRAEAQIADIDIEGNDDFGLRAQNLSTNSVRALARWENIYLTSNVPLFTANQTAFFEAGMRRDSGDGESRRAAMETTIGWNYRGQRATIEAAMHGLVGRKDYREWGAYTNLRISGGDDGQGLSLRVRPSYGEAQGEFGRVWDADSFDDIVESKNDSTAYQWRTETRLSYGIQSASGLVAPFVDAADDTYRLGVDWSPHRYFDVNLTGERRHSSDDADERRVLLQGEVKF